MMSLFYFVGSIVTLFTTAAAAPTNVPVSIVQTRVSGSAGARETTPSFNPNTFRDGGLYQPTSTATICKSSRTVRPASLNTLSTDATMARQTSPVVQTIHWHTLAM